MNDGFFSRTQRSQLVCFHNTKLRLVRRNDGKSLIPKRGYFGKRCLAMAFYLFRLVVLLEIWTVAAIVFPFEKETTV